MILLIFNIQPGEIVTVTRVKKARFVGADAKMSLAPGIPIDLHPPGVSIRFASNDVVVLDPLEKKPPISGNNFNMLSFVWCQCIFLFCYCCLNLVLCSL